VTSVNYMIKIALLLRQCSWACWSLWNGYVQRAKMSHEKRHLIVLCTLLLSGLYVGLLEALASYELFIVH